MTLAEHAELTWAHIARSASMSIDRARRLLGYRPRYTSLQAIAEALQWLPRHGEVDIGPDELTRLTQPHRDREAILEGVGSSRHCPGFKQWTLWPTHGHYDPSQLSSGPAEWITAVRAPLVRLPRHRV